MGFPCAVRHGGCLCICTLSTWFHLQFHGAFHNESFILSFIFDHSNGENIIGKGNWNAQIILVSMKDIMMHLKIEILHA